MKPKTFYEPVFRVEVGLLICSSEELGKHTKKLNTGGIKESNSTAGAVYPLISETGCKSWLVWFAKKPTLNDLVHESFHLAEQILSSRGITIDENGANEAFAYYQEWWFGTIRKAVE